MELPTEIECHLISQLRYRLEDLDMEENDLSNQQLLRWIRARDHNIFDAETMFRNSALWRQQIDVKYLLQWKPDEMFMKKFPISITGFDYDGCPVIVAHVGRMDFRTALDEGYLEDGLKYIYKMLERVLLLLKQLSVKQECMKQVTAIADMEGLQFRQVTSRKILTEFAKILGVYEGNYPEILKSAILVNVPSIFAIIYRMINRLLTTRTLSKIQIHNYDMSKYSAEILKIMAPEQFPEKYGGAALPTANAISLEDLLNSNY